MIPGKCIISVAEPWNFESQDGENVIRGSILSIKNNKCLVFKSNYDLYFGEIKGNILILTPRYEGIDFSNLDNERLVFNGSILLGEYNNQLTESELFGKSKLVIVGSMKTG